MVATPRRAPLAWRLNFHTRRMQPVDCLTMPVWLAIHDHTLDVQRHSPCGGGGGILTYTGFVGRIALGLDA